MEFETRRGERASYGAFFVGQNIIYFLMLQFLNLFYTDVVGIGAAAVGILFFVARTWDAVNDPILGSIVDRADFKGGKFLPWIKMVNIALPFITVLLFINPGWGAAGNLAYAYATYIVWGMVYTLCDVPIFALSTAMTKNPNERVVLLTWGRVAALLAGAIIAGTGMPLIEAMGWTPVALSLSVVAMIFMLPIRFFAIERIQRTNQSHPTVSQTIHYLRSHRPMIVLYLALLGAFATKFTPAGAVGVGGLLLSMYGYVPNVAQSEDTLHGIFALYTLFPAFGALASAWIMYQFYNLHEADVQHMIDVDVDVERVAADHSI